MDRIDLAGVWQIRHDRLSQGLTDAWWKPSPADGWRDIRVPSAWQSVLGIDANGVAWYWRDLPRQILAWPRAMLRFESVATDCRVWVNAAEVGRSLGDYVPFEFDITRALANGDGLPRLVVRVDQMHAPRPGPGVVTENGHVTKGFHDVLSAQHAGIWGGVSVRCAASSTIIPNGLAIDADPVARRVRILAEFDGPVIPCETELTDPDGKTIARTKLAPNGQTATGSVDLAPPTALWSPDSPRLYTATLRFGDEIVTQRFGFRTIATGGAGNSRVLLNGRPIQIRGLLHWGHEPRHIAPAPPREQVRAELAAAIERGFNCVCLCMFYPPEHYFDVCDELGVLVWQEHPVWKSRMTPDTFPEYRRMYEQFFRRDRRHPGVVIVSATCEHDSFDAGLSRWWWERSGQMLPRTLRQVQTGFLEWTPPDQTDLYDDHVYDSCGRWVNFVKDMDARIGSLPPKPFVMGETTISNAWPDIATLREAAKNGTPWWMSRGVDECAAYECEVQRRQGADTLTRFKVQVERFALEHRKFQAEVLRTFDRCAGFVTNSIRDVPICRIGFIDDLDRWRFTPEQTRPWLSSTVLLLRTPGHFRGFAGASSVRCEIGVSNYGSRDFNSGVRVRVGEGQERVAHLKARIGETAWHEIDIEVPSAAQSPKAFTVAASVGTSLRNSWTLVALPAAAALDGIVRLEGLPYSAKELEPTFEERSYSSGWGLPCRSWSPVRLDPAELIPDTRAIAPDANIPAGVRTVLTHRLTPRIKGFLESGGRCVLLAGPHAGGIGGAWINLWGLLPLVVESAAPSALIAPGESDAILAMLMHDLTARTTRAIPLAERDLLDHVDPIIRYVYTHDSGVPKLFDAVFSARVGTGLLIVTTLDHSTVAGAWLLRRLLRSATDLELPAGERELDITPMLSG